MPSMAPQAMYLPSGLCTQISHQYISTTCHTLLETITQLTLHFRRDELAASIERHEQCIEDVDQWMSANGLMLNVDKT